MALVVDVDLTSADIKQIFARTIRKDSFDLNLEMPRKFKRWSEAEVGELIKLREEGFTANEIAVELNLPYSLVFRKCSRLVKKGLVENRVGSRKVWNEKDKLKLIELREKKISFKEIANIFQCSESAVSSQVTKLIRAKKIAPLSRSERGKRGNDAFVANRPDKWTDKEKQKLASLWKEGMTAKEISPIIGRTRLSVNGELKKLREENLVDFLSAEDKYKRFRRKQIESYDKRYADALETVKSLPDTRLAGYVIGVIFGDGSVTYKANQGYTTLKSTNESFCLAFAQAIEETFNRKASVNSRIEPIKKIGKYVYENVRYYGTTLCSAHIAKAIKEVFGATDKRNWRVDSEYALQIGQEFAKGVIQGFFDSEDSFMQKKGKHLFYLTMCSMNEKGIKSIHKLLTELGYKANIYVDSRGQWRIGISTQSEVCKFANDISSRIDYKLERMKFCLSGNQ